MKTTKGDMLVKQMHPAESKNFRNMSQQHRAFLIGCVAVCFIVAGALPLSAAGRTKWEIVADTLTRYEKPASVIAEGNVVLKETGPDGEALGSAGMVIHGDWMVYDVEKGTAKGRGNLHIVTGGDELFAAEGFVRLESKTGTFKQAILLQQRQDVHLEGAVLEKTGENTYHLENGWVVTCRLEEGQTAPWSVWSKDVTVNRGGYAVLRHATFRIKDVPVLYTPYFVVPVKNERQTGFLFPEFSQSDRSGFGILFPFFWNISPSADLTIYPGYLADRGATLGVEARYVVGPESQGMFAATFLKDDLVETKANNFKEDSTVRTESNRFWLRGKANQKFGGDIEARLDLDVVSDHDFLEEFENGVIGFLKSNRNFQQYMGRSFNDATIYQRTNSIQVKRNWSGMSLMGEMIGINDVRPGNTWPTPVWTLPRVKFSGFQPIMESQFDFLWDAEYVTYWRRQGNGYNRLDLYPKVSSPLPVGPYFEGSATLGLRETMWMFEGYGDSDWTGVSSKERFLYDFNANLATTWQRDFKVNFSGLNMIRHRIRPEVSYSYKPDAEIRQQGILRLDGTDFIGQKNSVTYGVQNYFNTYGVNENGAEQTRDVGFVKVSQSYNINEARRDVTGTDKTKPFGDVVFDVWFSPTERTRLEYDSRLNVYDDKITEYNISGWYNSLRGDSLTLDYRYKFKELHDLNLNINARLLRYFTLQYGVKHDLRRDEVSEENVALIYHPECWSMILSSSWTEDNRTFMVIFQLANIGHPFSFMLPGSTSTTTTNQ